MAEEKEHVLEFDGSYKCAVVDDSAFMVKNLERMLEGFGAEVVGTAEDGVEAVELVEEKGDELDFITLDITMPEKDGLEALDEILDMKSNLTVVMVSAMGQEDTVKTAIKKGAEYFIVKPFERDDVFVKLEKVLGD